MPCPTASTLLERATNDSRPTRSDELDSATHSPSPTTHTYHGWFGLAPIRALLATTPRRLRHAAAEPASRSFKEQCKNGTWLDPYEVMDDTRPLLRLQACTTRIRSVNRSFIFIHSFSHQPTPCRSPPPLNNLKAPGNSSKTYYGPSYDYDNNLS